MEAFILGLSSGTTCLAKCGSVLFPYLMNKQSSFKSTSKELGIFLLTRFLIYLLIGGLLGLLGENLFLMNEIYRQFFLGFTSIGLAILLVVQVFFSKRKNCSLSKTKKIKRDKGILKVPLAMGIVSSLNVCPPLLIALTEGATRPTPGSGMLYFSFFFLGTLIYFVPLPFLSLTKKQASLQLIGRYSAGIASIIIFYKGFILLTGGFSHVI